MSSLTRAEIAKHNTEEDLWCIIDHKVYDLTEFQDAHPGGSVVLRQVAGQDATRDFYNLHRQEVIQKFSELCIGTVEGEKPEIIEHIPGALSTVPYAEPTWLRPEFKSPYFKDSHRRLQKAMRKFVDEVLTPEGEAREADGQYISQEVIDKMAEKNILAMRLGPGKHLKGRVLLDGAVEPEEFDYLHDMIVSQEMSRTTARGFLDGNLSGMVISHTVIQSWLHDEKLKAQLDKEVLTGQKKICLAVTEAFAGSDVGGLRTTAEKTPDGKHYIINGTKKWITNGTFCQWFVVACKTKKGYSVILVPRQEGVTTKPIKTSYSPTAGTAFVEFDNVKVPVGNLLGPEDNGFIVIMSNFNHERYTMACGVVQKQRSITEECLKWANQRIVFGKRLIDQPVIRLKLGRMMAMVESNQAYLESIAYQMCNMSYAKQNKYLGGPIALLKYQVTRSSKEIADEAVQIFGGRALTQTGMGRAIEMFNRTYKFDAILGGSEEILADLGVRQALKVMPKSML